jgi:outer membrane protein TolC
MTACSVLSLANNGDIKVATARVEEARASLAAQAALLPNIDQSYAALYKALGGGASLSR